MKRCLYLVFLFLLLAGISSVKAYDIVGADISYTYVSGTSYSVTAQCYMNCSGFFYSSIPLTVTDGSKSKSYGGSICCTKDITPVCSKACTLCTSSTCNFGFGIQKLDYTYSVDMSVFNGCKLTLSYQNTLAPNIANIPATVYYIYSESILNRCEKDHSSPVFESDPQFFSCLNKAHNEFVTVKPAFPDDSIVYSMVKPQQSSGSPYAYNTGFSYRSPISYAGYPAYYKAKPEGFHFDSITGELYFVPQKTATSITGFQAFEYHKDSTGKYYLWATAMRTNMLIPIDCDTNRIPYFDKAPETVDTIRSCAGMPLNFSVSTADSNKKDTLDLIWINQSPGKLYYSAYNVHPTINFSWSPGKNDVRYGPYFVTFKVKDNHCPTLGIAQKRFVIFIRDSLPTVHIKITDSGCGRYNLTPDKQFSKSSPFLFKWKVDGVIYSTAASCSYHTIKAGRHVAILEITHSQTGCVENITDTLFYNAAYKKLPDDTGICYGGSIQLKAAQGKNLTWSPGKLLNDSMIYNPVAMPDTLTLFTVKGTDANGCTYTDQVWVHVYNFKIKTDAVNNTVCSGSSLKLSSYGYTEAKYNWYQGIYYAFGNKDSAVVYPLQNTYYGLVASAPGCQVSDSVKITVNPTLDHYLDTTICQGDTILLNAHGGNSYKWLEVVHQKVVSTDSILKVSSNNTIGGAHYASIYINSKTGCQMNNPYNIRVTGFTPGISGSTRICAGQYADLKATGVNKYFWNTGNTATYTSQEIRFLPDSTFQIKALFTDTVTSCSRAFSFPVYVSPFPSNYQNQAICKGEMLTLHGAGSGSYIWHPGKDLSDSTIKNPVAWPAVPTLYKVTVFDSATQCQRTDSVFVYADNDCLYPGDANKDREANYIDVLFIALGNGQHGPPRNPDSTNWKEWHAQNWDSATATGSNFKHLDCDGNGVINAADTAVVSKNYSSTIIFYASGGPESPPLAFHFAKDTFASGDTAFAFIMAGDDEHPFAGVHGIGFKAFASGDPFESGSMTLKPQCDFFCPGESWFYVHGSGYPNSFDVAATLTGHNAVSRPTGVLAMMAFVLKDSNTFNYPLEGARIHAAINSAVCLNNQGMYLPLRMYDDSAIVLKKKIIRSDVQTYYAIPGLKIYPNPSSGILRVETGAIVPASIRLINALGQEVLSQAAHTSKTVIDASALPSGLYVVEIETGSGICKSRITIERP